MGMKKAIVVGVIGLLLLLAGVQMLQPQQPLQQPTLQRTSADSAICGVFRALKHGNEIYEGKRYKAYVMILIMAVPNDAPDPYFPDIKACSIPFESPKRLPNSLPR
jgi:hypothetical protein